MSTPNNQPKPITNPPKIRFPNETIRQDHAIHPTLSGNNR